MTDQLRQQPVLEIARSQYLDCIITQMQLMQKESTLKQLADARLRRDYEDAVAVLDRIPKEVLAAYTHRTEKERENAYGR